MTGLADVMDTFAPRKHVLSPVCVHLALRLSLGRVDRVGPVSVRQRGWLDGLLLAETSGGRWRAVDEGVSIDWREGVQWVGLFCRPPRAVIWQFVHGTEQAVCMI